MTGFLARRLFHALVTMVVAVSLIFIAMRMLPGNPLLARFGQHPDAEQMQRIIHEQGWDKPILSQLGQFLHQIATTGDFGESISRSNENVSDELSRRIPATIELTVMAMLLAIPLGIAFGIAAAVWRNRWPDRLCMAGAMIGVSVPVFFLGICLRALFTGMPIGFRLPAFELDFEPITEFYLLDTLLQRRFDLFRTAVKHVCLPALALSSIPMSIIARITRSSMLEVLGADFVRTGRAKGASKWRVVLRHALPNAAAPIVNIAGFQIGVLLSGAVLTETVFDWPGMGKYVVDAVRENDYVIVQAGAFVIATIFVTANLIVDLLYLWLDPRVRIS
ncbi:MAG: ABC transporter permease [Planctomycetaceae bacterium]|nr:ABC transporter permease [Planctomycetales bacterium]MCB9924015.1 ABC transporter permease [Planctomycetaceae bacterium]